MIADFPAVERSLCREQHNLAIQIGRLQADWNALDAARRICRRYYDHAATEALDRTCEEIARRMDERAARHDELERDVECLAEARGAVT